MHPTTAIPLETLLAFAHALADAAGAAILPHFRRPAPVANKAEDGGFDPVTAADRAAEEVMIRMVADRWPDHRISGEEFGDRTGDSRYRWLFDPIDGTRAFITGSPLWGTLIGVADGVEPLLGIMDQPFTGERFWSGANASYLRVGDEPARAIRTRACPRLADAVLTSTHPDLFAPASKAAFVQLGARVRMTRFGGDCYGYCLLAAGFTDLVVESELKPFDVAALIPIIERAGGRITTWEGESALDGGRVVAAGDPALHEAVLNELAR